MMFYGQLIHILSMNILHTVIYVIIIAKMLQNLIRTLNQIKNQEKSVIMLTTKYRQMLTVGLHACLTS